MLNSIDLFSGCGGMTLGFKWAGFNSVLASDIDENCEKTFLANFPDVPFLCGDISIFEKKDFDVFLKRRICYNQFCSRGFYFEKSDYCDARRVVEGTCEYHFYHCRGELCRTDTNVQSLSRRRCQRVG